MARGTYVAKMWTVILGELVLKNLAVIGSCGGSRVVLRMLKACLANLVDIGVVGTGGRRATRALWSSTRKSNHGWTVPDQDDVTFAELGFLSLDDATMAAQCAGSRCHCHCRDRIYPSTVPLGCRDLRDLSCLESSPSLGC